MHKATREGISLGITLRASSALCLGSLGPLDTCSRTVLLHQMFVAASVDQFAIFCLNLVVTATFIPQEHLRLIPIFAGLFSVGRFSYWVTLHLCSAYRGFGSARPSSPTSPLMAYNLFSASTCERRLSLVLLEFTIPG
uniref:Uncharacterized protein n=1 Tax=Sphaerodactylus townsendi TaxID=933632 RepID=A0ACB8F0X1_9SAUR